MQPPTRRTVAAAAAAAMCMALAARGQATPATAVADEAVIRLVAHDDLRRSFGFTTGDHGLRVIDGVVHNANSQLMLGRDGAGNDVLRFGWQGSERGYCVDLGTLRDKATMSSLFWRIDQPDAARRLADATVPSAPPVVLDHVYVARIDDIGVAGAGFARGQTMWLRVHVLDHAPGRYVELRYSILRDPDAEPAPREAVEGDPMATEAWKRNKTQRADEVLDLRSATPAAPWPADLDATRRRRIERLVQAVRRGGRDERAELVATGYDALPGILNQLRELDYMDAEQAWYGWELNRVLEEISVGLSTGYAPVRPGEQVDPRKADHNAKASRAWFALLQQFPSRESWAKFAADRTAGKRD